jgi:hypothetical protein
MSLHAGEDPHPRRRGQLEADGWTYCGSWMNTYHYVKRAERVAA